MYQMIGRKSVYVVDFDTMPELPITGLTEGEKVYEKAIDGASFPQGSFWTLAGMFAGRKLTIAEALTDALETGVITEPGKYGVHLVPGKAEYEIFTINE
jgi:hypothetical protein